MAESVVSFVGERLAELVAQEKSILLGVKERVNQMQNELGQMKDFLKIADKKQDKDETVRKWVSEIREAAYDAEAVIETFALKIASIRRGGIQNAVKRYACIVNEAKEIHRVNSDIEGIKEKISEARARMRTYVIAPNNEGEGLSSALERQRRQAFSHVKEYPVGLDGDVKILVTQLVNEDEHWQVVSICGMGGLGKTTLAREVFRHSEINRHFDAVAWASISQECDRKKVWEEILIDLISPSDKQRKAIKEYKEGELAAELCKVQEAKKCLVILDDFWRVETWNLLKDAFSLEKTGSKMLLTTRNKKVAWKVHRGGFVHEPQCLTQEEGWELLQNEILRKTQGFTISTEMKELGRDMVGRCCGLPLAIVMLGTLLLETRLELDDWKKVHSTFKGGEGHEQQQSTVFEVLALSYHELPYQLKPCFLHLGHFPEDFDIPTKRLVRIWVAEGIVSSPRGETLEDIAECYLRELVDRCMVQERVKGSTGRVKTCRLHNLMRDLCLLKAKQEKFLKIVHGPSSTETIPEPSERVSRLAIFGNPSWESEKTSHLRSLLCFYTKEEQKKKPRFKDFKLLKTLDLEHCNIKGDLTTTVGNLIHLRYLSLNCSHIRVIPLSLGNLRYLQTLIIRTDEATQISLPNVIWKMKQLRHLCLPYCADYVREDNCKLRLGDLSDLQTLQGIGTRSFDVNELVNFRNLTKLGISELENLQELGRILILPCDTLNLLHSFKIFRSWFIKERDLWRLLSACRNLRKLYLGGRIEKLPKCNIFPQNLTKLTLCHSKLEEDPMETLEKLHDLSVLRLICGAFDGKKMVCSSRGFLKLESLVLSDLCNLEEWHVGEEAMPELCELVIESCSELRIIEMHEEFKNRLRVGNEGGEDLRKVQHRPPIIFKGPHSLLGHSD